MLSPDGKWVWDGSQWQPIARHESVFPSWQTVTVEPAGQVAAPAPMMPTPTAAPAPAIVQPVPPSLLFPQSAQPAAPLWAKAREIKPTGMNNYLYFVAGIVAIVIILIVLNSVFPLWLLLPGPKPPAAPPSPQPSPIAALTARSPHARADHFLNAVLPTAWSTLDPTLTSVHQTCSKQLTNSCEAAITAAQPEIKKTLAVIDKSSVPDCIASQVARLRGDLAGMGSALDLAAKAYNDNQASELVAAMGSYNQHANPLGGDLQAIASAIKTSCDSTVTGP